MSAPLEGYAGVVFAVVFGLVGCGTGEASSDEEADDVGETESAQSVGSCMPARAVGAVDSYKKALHDSIAFAEGTEGRGGRDGYNVLFTHRTITSCARHPNIRNCSGRLCSTAAGRYQFLQTTWNQVSRAIRATNFEPENQERGATYLITRVRRVNVPAGRAMSAAEFSNAMSKLSYEWASLPPGRYGQPTKTHSQMRADYCRNVGGC